MSEVNEHAERLMEMARYCAEYGGEAANRGLELAACAAEIERLAARVAELQKAIFDERRQWASHVCPDNDRPWWPIDSSEHPAPRDGTRVELWCESPLHGHQNFACYGRHETGDDYEQWLSDTGFDLQPTHWRPEPQGPKE